MMGADRGPRSKNTEYVRAQPFSAWLSDRYEFHLQGRPSWAGDAMTRLLAEIGWPTNEAGARRLYRYRYGLMSGSRNGVKGPRKTDWFERDVVEDALHMAGVSIYALYPELGHERDVELEPDTWCPGCQDHVTPIRGECPWCSWRMEPWGQVAA
jgi:hypothetical protein